MKILTLMLAIASILPVASATELKNIALPLPVLLKQLNREPLSGIPLPSHGERLNTPEQTALYWTYLYGELFTKGAATFAYKNEQYAVKLLFRKGQYDEVKGNYISTPGVYIINTTNIEAIKREFWINLNVQLDDIPYTTLSGDKIKIRNAAGIFSLVSKSGFSDKTIFSVPHDQLFKLWADNAENYKRTVHGKTIYLVPQMSAAKGDMTQVGFVVSEGKPFIKPTGHPLDFLALCQAKEKVTCKPMSYSIPLGLKFHYLGKEGSTDDNDFFYWQIEEMVNEDLNNSLDEEALEVSLTIYE